MSGFGKHNTYRPDANADVKVVQTEHGADLVVEKKSVSPVTVIRMGKQSPDLVKQSEGFGNGPTRTLKGRGDGNRARGGERDTGDRHGRGQRDATPHPKTQLELH